jgi:hypothetical protein
MQALQRIRNNPIVVLGVLIVALFVWITMDLLSPPSPPQVAISRGDGTVKKKAKFVPVPSEDIPPVHSTPVELGMLPKLKPGMTRTEVEQLIGPPEPDQIQPVTQTNGSLTYCTAYELVGSQPLMTIRPIQPKASRIPNKPAEPKSHVTLEYDASKPGHPLIEVHFSDPLF